MNEILRPDEAESSRCPHFEVVDEETLRRLFSKVAAVRSEDYELFQFTHRPMEVYRGTSAGGETWTEDRIYQEFSENRIGNFAVVIEGEVGTGKSELCAYLSHRLRRDGRPMLHIDKDDDLMSILSERIPDFYEDQFGEKLPGASDFKNLRDDIVDIPQAVANNATSGTILGLRRRDFDVSPGAEQENKIRDYVAEKLERLVKRGEYAQKIQFVGENEYKQREELQIFDDSTSVEDAVEAFNEELWRVIREQYNTASLDDVLEQVGKQFEETRPVIVFEDFSIAAMEAERLRNYMERDKGSDNWDFIVAGTSDSTEVLHTRTAEDRFEFFQTNEKESNKVLFLDEDTAVDFVRPYLGYIKAHDGSVRYERDPVDDTYTLVDPPEGSLCERCGFCEESFRDLFPFNQPFLQRIYTGLDESQQSPREFIMTVFEVLQDYHDGFIEAPSSADTLRSLRNTVSVADTVYEEAEAYADLAKWYGRKQGGDIVIDRQFVDAFDFDTASLPGAIVVTDEAVRVDTTGDGPTDRCPQCGEDAWTVNEDGDRICSNCGYRPGGGGGGQTPLEQEIDEQKSQIDSWMEDPSKYPDTDHFIRQGLRDLFDELTDDFRLFEGSPLEYRLSSQKDPFVYPDATAAPDDDQILLDRADFRRSDLRRLVEFGVRRDKDPQTADYEAQLEASGTQLTYYAQQWRGRIFETQLESNNVLYKRRAKYDFTDFIVASYATLTLLDSPWRTVTAERLNDRYQSDEPFSVDEDMLTGLREEVARDDIQRMRDAMEDVEYVEAIIGELLGVSASTLDVPDVRARLKRSPPNEVLQMLGRNYIQNIDFRTRFESGHTIREFADAMYDTGSVLEDVVEHEYRRDIVTYVSETLDGTDMETITDRYQKLKTYDTVDADLKEQLGQACRYSQEDVDEVVEAAMLADELSSEYRFARLNATLASLKLENDPLVTDFRAVPLTGASAPTNLGSDFTEVSSHYVQ